MTRFHDKSGKSNGEKSRLKSSFLQATIRRSYWGWPRRLHMSFGNKNLIAAYSCLVGIPILGLLGILDIGHGLRAPIAIGGTWDVQVDLHSLASTHCDALLASTQPWVLDISQSG